MEKEVKLLLAAARVNNGYTLKQAAELIGIHYQTLSKWEKDSTKVTVAEANNIAKIYHIPSNIIFFGKRNEFIRFNQRRDRKEIS